APAPQRPCSGRGRAAGFGVAPAKQAQKGKEANEGRTSLLVLDSPDGDTLWWLRARIATEIRDMLCLT
ncbi:MAG: hypothetical protein MI919_26505, partial [Holophagales bacterium]|nr:hypothetical protein [Holophagales bacterium]